MPDRLYPNDEKSPVDGWDYGGLQVDTRIKDNQDPHLDILDGDLDSKGNFLIEKQAHAGTIVRASPASPDPTLDGIVSPITPIVPNTIDAVFSKGPATTPSADPESEREPVESRACGLRRHHFWELFGLILAIVLTAAIVGGVVGGIQAHDTGSPKPAAAPANASNTNTTNTTTTTTTFQAPQSADVMVGSPLNVISYDQGGSGSAESRQSFRIYYQSVIGNIKEAVSDGMVSWQSARPIFTDATNNTGLATVTYLNGTQQQGSIFYVGMNGLVQEKRKIFSNTDYWLPGNLNSLNLAATGNISLPSESDDPKNDWDSYRMAAVYSSNFMSGPGIRLFYHAQQLNGSSVVQEMIWSQTNDSWSHGAQIHDAWPNSHLAATVDESAKTLRLFYSSGNKSLQESWTSITDQAEQYNAGVHLSQYLDYNSADVTALSSNGTTYVYHYASANQTANTGIHELTITGEPKSIDNQESYNLSEPLVSTPNLSVGGNLSLYQPLAASKTVVPGLSEEIYVFWADKVTGDQWDPANNITGFADLSEISRPTGNTSWPSVGQLHIPLGSSNSQPS